MSERDAVVVSIEVALPPPRAFALFTEEVDAWWGRGPKYRNRDVPSVLRFEPGVGGRLVEVYADGEFQVGEISAWEPGARLVMSWHPTNFAPGETTEVEIRFEACSAGTRVRVLHRGWDTLRPDHPARHGLAGRDFTLMRGGWWSELLAAYSTRSTTTSTPREGAPCE